jgi:hypothetical protein
MDKATFAQRCRPRAMSQVRRTPEGTDLRASTSHRRSAVRQAGVLSHPGVPFSLYSTTRACNPCTSPSTLQYPRRSPGQDRAC